MAQRRDGADRAAPPAPPRRVPDPPPMRDDDRAGDGRGEARGADRPAGSRPGSLLPSDDDDVSDDDNGRPRGRQERWGTLRGPETGEVAPRGGAATASTPHRLAPHGGPPRDDYSVASDDDDGGVQVSEELRAELVKWWADKTRLGNSAAKDTPARNLIHGCPVHALSKDIGFEGTKWPRLRALVTARAKEEFPNFKDEVGNGAPSGVSHLDMALGHEGGCRSISGWQTAMEHAKQKIDQYGRVRASDATIPKGLHFFLHAALRSVGIIKEPEKRRRPHRNRKSGKGNGGGGGGHGRNGGRK